MHNSPKQEHAASKGTQIKASRLHRYWVAGAVIALLLAAWGAQAVTPAQAAPPAAHVYQTVPKPTPQPGNDPVATATPRPNDDEDSSSNNNAGNQDNAGAVEPPPVFFLPSDAPATNLTAKVTVATLNVRSGPGPDFVSVGILRAGEVVQVAARNDANTWWLICCIAGTSDQGWVSAELLEPNFDRGQSANLIPLFNAQAKPATAVATNPTPAQANAAQAKLSLALDLSLAPAMIWQGQTADLVLEISNPNAAAATSVGLSDQLPVEFELVKASATGNGQVSEQTTPAGATLILVRWESIPANGSVKAIISVQVSEDVEDGQVFDNLAAVRGSNAAYTTAALSVGMPPASLPDFQ